jgi:hypothetical protein
VEPSRRAAFSLVHFTESDAPSCGFQAQSARSTKLLCPVVLCEVCYNHNYWLFWTRRRVRLPSDFVRVKRGNQSQLAVRRGPGRIGAAIRPDGARRNCVSDRAAKRGAQRTTKGGLFWQDARELHFERGKKSLRAWIKGAKRRKDESSASWISKLGRPDLTWRPRRNWKSKVSSRITACSRRTRARRAPISDRPVRP